jgi:aspartyl-tRNA(Asn)/glutamyl-tRNA(Gln) amidotransferase subunit C
MENKRFIGIYMARISKEEVLKIAQISRISVQEDEIGALIAQLEAVLEYAARVHEVADGQQLPLPQNRNIFRPDVVIPFASEAILKQAPQIEADYFVVPAILEHE